MAGKSAGSISFLCLPDLGESGAFSSALQDFVSKSVPELWHGECKWHWQYRDLQEMAGNLAGWFSPVKGSFPS